MGRFLLKNKKNWAIIIIAAWALLIAPSSVYALDLGVATYVDVAEAKTETIEDGTLLVSTLDGLYLSRYPYDPALAGVTTVKSAIVLGVKQAASVPMVSKGTIAVRVSTINGPITKGDPLTSSSIPGVAMKATRTGTAIGNAIEDYTERDPAKIGKVMSIINIQYNLSGAKTDETQTVSLGIILRSAMATLLAIITTVVGFSFFGRFAMKGVESLGRNPMASSTIRIGMFIQGGLFILLMAAGYLLAYLLVR